VYAINLESDKSVASTVRQNVVKPHFADKMLDQTAKQRRGSIHYFSVDAFSWRGRRVVHRISRHWRMLTTMRRNALGQLVSVSRTSITQSSVPCARHFVFVLVSACRLISRLIDQAVHPSQTWSFNSVFVVVCHSFAVGLYSVMSQCRDQRVMTCLI